MLSPKCSYCNQMSKLIDSKEIYGTSYGMVYYCEPCNASVGVHKGTLRPLGTLANKPLRDARRKAHGLFDRLWKGKKRSRKQAYEWLQGKMGLSEYDCHIGRMDLQQCEELIKLLRIRFFK